MSVRTAAAAALQTALGKSFDVRDDEDLPDKLSRSVVTTRLVDYTPAENGQGSMRANIRFTVISPLNDAGKADDQLEGTEDQDGTLPTTLKAIRDVGFVWTKSTRVLVKETYIGHAIDAWQPTETPY